MSVLRASVCLHVICGFAFAQTPTTTSLRSSLNPAIFGRPVTLTATVTSGASGKVTFYDGAMVLGIGVAGMGEAILTTSLLTPGPHSITARYDGNSNFAPSVSPSQVQVVSAGAANGYQPRISYLVPAPNSLAIGDFNRDGKLDIVTAIGEGNGGSVMGYGVNGGISVLLGNGDGTMRPAVNYTLAGTQSTTVLVGDFNGDGIADVLVNSTYLPCCVSQGVFVFLGNGDGTFQAPLQTPTPDVYQYNNLAVADFDGDGQLDIAATSQFGVDLLFGNGDGTFRTPVRLSSSLYPLNLVVADVNLDGKPDLVADEGFSAAILLGNGDGTFKPELVYASSYTEAENPQVVGVGDFNGDGKPDLVYVSLYGTEVMLGNGDGTFQAPILANSVLPSPGSVLLVGDFNGDGRMDVAYQCDLENYFEACIGIMLGNGDGTFQAAIVIPTDGGGPIFGTAGLQTAIALADFNGDGVPDLAVANESSNNVDLFLGGQFVGLGIAVMHRDAVTAGQSKTYTITVTDSAFAAAPGLVTVTDSLPPGWSATSMSGMDWSCVLTALTCTIPSGLSSGSSFSAIALTAIAPPDLAPGTVVNTATVKNNDVANSVGDPTLVVAPTTTTLSVSPKSTELNQAVTLTARVSNGEGSVLFLEDSNILGDATLSGNQASITTRLIPTGDHKVSATYAGDSTHGASTSPGVSLTVNARPSSSFSAGMTIVTGTNPAAVLAADLNGDGEVDLVVPNLRSSSVSVFLGNGDGTFQPKVDYVVGEYPTDAAIADFNGDGKLDIAVSNQLGINILLNNGDGTFHAGAIIAAPAFDIVAGDFDGDGKADLADFSDILFGSGDGAFQPGAVLLDDFCCDAPLAVGDFNGDGKPDLLVGDYVFLNNGDGTFGQRGVALTSYSAAAIGDLNGDGKADLVTTDGETGVNVFLGNGDGTFQPAIHYMTGSDPYSDPYAVTLADTNGDGKLDVIVTNSGKANNSVSVLLGNGDGTFQPAVSYSVGTSPMGVVAGDFNGDGRTDLAVANTGDNTVTILLGIECGAERRDNSCGRVLPRPHESIPVVERGK